MGVCCIVYDIDGMLFEFFMNFLNIEKNNVLRILLSPAGGGGGLGGGNAFDAISNISRKKLFWGKKVIIFLETFFSFKGFFVLFFYARS